MKHIFALFTAFFFILTLSGCSTSAVEETASMVSTDPAVESAPATVDYDYEYPVDANLTINTLENAKNANGKSYTIAIASDVLPFAGDDGAGMLGGFELQLYAGIASEMGFTIEWEVIDAAEAADLLKNGNVDALAGSLLQSVGNHSASYYDTELVFAVPVHSTMTSIDDLPDRTILCRSGTLAQPIAEDLADEYDATASPMADFDEVRYSITTAQASGCIELREAAEAAGLTVMSGTSEPYSLCLSTEDSVLLDAFDVALNRMQADGRYHRYVEDYIDTTLDSES